MNTQGPISQSNHAAAALDEIKHIAVPASFLRGNGNDAMVSSNGKGEKRDLARLHCSHDFGCADTMHELANSMTAVLINAQVLEWKLPPYSRLKRPVREIERHAQRSGALLKRLLGEFEINPPEAAKQEFCAGPLLARDHARGDGPGAGDDGRRAGETAAPDAVALGPHPGSSPETVLTSLCDRCTSILFPKEER